MEKENKKYPEGHFVGIWMAIGIAIFCGIGVPLSIILKIPGLIGIGPAMGVAFGLAIGQSIENRYRNAGKIRPLTEAEKKRKRILILSGVLLLIFGLLLFLLRLS